MDQARTEETVFKIGGTMTQENRLLEDGEEPTAPPGMQYYIYKVTGPDGTEYGGFIGNCPEAILDIPLLKKLPKNTPAVVMEVSREDFIEFKHTGEAGEKTYDPGNLRLIYAIQPEEVKKINELLAPIGWSVGSIFRARDIELNALKEKLDRARYMAEVKARKAGKLPGSGYINNDPDFKAALDEYNKLYQED